MHKFIVLSVSLLTTLLINPPLQAADNNQQLLQQQIDVFNHSDNHQFAPQTIKRAEAFMGAAMLADDQNNQPDKDAAVSKAAETLAEARQTAADFKQRFAALINLRQGAIAITEIIASSGRAINDLTPKALMQDAASEFTQAIARHEGGEFNQMQQHIDAATQDYKQALDKTLPWLTELTASIIGKAANTNAKRYAPRIYQAAKDKLAELEAFELGKNRNPPNHPEEGLYLARESRHVAEQVKAWRKKSSSHETLVLKNRKLKLEMANELGISDSANPMLTDIRGKNLLLAVKKLNSALADEREAHRADMARIAIEYKHKLVTQADAIKQAQQSKLSDIKEAFHAKLARETFEKKRQAQLHKLFSKGEAEILLNLDGSLLVRLTALKFHSGRSKIASKYFDMMQRLKQAMDIYQDRNLRIEGHTDSLGDVKPNQLLSLRRAEAVRDFLIASGADASRLKALGYGEVRPIASNEFKQGRAMNRRIDVVINAPK